MRFRSRLRDLPAGRVRPGVVSSSGAALDESNVEDKEKG